MNDSHEAAVNLSQKEEKKPKKDTQSKKYLLTINNPTEHGITHESIQEILANNFKSLVYACMSDEVANQHHKHVFLAFTSPVRFSQIKNISLMLILTNPVEQQRTIAIMSLKKANGQIAIRLKPI